jgi:single-strand DNA-binding protein
MSFSQLTIVGNVGQPPSFKTIRDKEVCSFSIAVNRKVKDAKVTTWFNVVSWDERKNHIIREYVSKGKQVMVIGSLQPREYTDKDGAKRTALDVDISYGGHLVLLSSQERSDDEPRAEPKRQAAAAPADDMPDDMPF